MPVGTLVEIEFGNEMPGDGEALDWGSTAISLTNGGPAYPGRTSAHWYGPDSFFELLQAAGQLPVREVIAQLEGCSGAKAGKIAAAYKSTACRTTNREQAADLLQTARDWTKPVRPERLGAIGERGSFPGYSVLRGIVDLGGKAPAANIPFCIESWARSISEEETRVTFSINRTPTLARFMIFRLKKDFNLRARDWPIASMRPPATTKSKSTSPHLIARSAMTARSPISNRSGTRSSPRSKRPSSKRGGKLQRQKRPYSGLQKAVILDHLEDIIRKASGDGAYRFQLRQTFYVARPIVMDELELKRDLCEL